MAPTRTKTKRDAQAYSDGPVDADRVRDALSFLAPSCDRHQWVQVGMCIKNELGHAGFDVWDQWSRESDKYNQKDAASTWKSIKAEGKRTIASLFGWAKEAGWKPSASGKKWTKAEIEAHKAAQAERQRRQVEESARQHAEDARRLAEVRDHWRGGALDPVDNDYIIRKEGKPDGLRQVSWPLRGWDKFKDENLDGWLMVPAYAGVGNAGDLMSIQYIGPKKGEKLNAPVPIKGCTFTVGELKKGEKAFIVEGVGHAWSMNLVTGSPAVVAFSAGNIEVVAAAVQEAGAIPVLVADRGKEADADRIAARLGCWYAPLPEDLPIGSDVNDLHLARDDDAVRAVVAGATLGKMPEEQAAAAPTRFDDGAQESSMPDASAHDQDAPQDADKHFRILGFDGDGNIAFYHHGREQLLIKNRRDFQSELGFIELADLNWWEDSFPSGGGKSGINRSAAFQWLYATAITRPMFNGGDRLRGLGAWRDGERTVFHAGEQLVVDGVNTKLSEFKSPYIYGQASRFGKIATPATDEEGQHLLDIAEMARWACKDSARFLAGFLFLAPICGVLPWRPHIWLTGGKGSGKSTLVERFMPSMLGGVCRVYDGGSSTEPGIRQDLGVDARPVLIDEIEADDKNLDRVNKILQLIRSSSSAKLARSVKGTVGGKPLTFVTRSSFCLSSVNVGLVKATDTSRFAVLNLRPAGAGDGHPGGFAQVDALLAKIESDDDLPGRLLGRALGMVPVILESVRIFSAAVAQHRKDQRFGDQHGTLLAGSWCLTHSVAPTAEQAQAIAESINWEAAVAHQATDSTPDEQRCLQQLLDQKISHHGNQVALRTLIKIAHGITVEGVGIEPPTAKRLLNERWINITKQKGGMAYLAIKHQSNGVNELLARTSFEIDWAGHLARLPGYKKLDKTSFGSADKMGKAHGIPLSLFLQEEEPPIDVPAWMADDPDHGPF